MQLHRGAVRMKTEHLAYLDPLAAQGCGSVEPYLAVVL